MHSASEMRLLAGAFPAASACSPRPRPASGGRQLVFQTPDGRTCAVHRRRARGRELSRARRALRSPAARSFPTIWFDFGISNERDGRLNDGLLRNKEGYGARAIVHDRYALDLR